MRDNRLEMPKDRHPPRESLEYEMAEEAIASLKSELIERGEADNLFGQERGPLM